MERRTEPNKDISDILKSVISKSNSTNMNKLREYFGNDIVFVDMLDENTETKKCEDSELLENELSKLTHKLGCYDVMITERLYEHTDKIFSSAGGCSVLEIHAKHCSTDKYKFICNTSLLREDMPQFIGVVKDNSSVSDDMANLFVLKKNSVEGETTDLWFILTFYGAIEKFEAVKDEDNPEKTIWYSLKTVYDNDT